MRKTIFFLLISSMLIGTYSCSILNKAKKMKEQQVKIETSEGVIVVKLYNETPLHRDNFLKLVNEKFYDGVLFHRVISDFMIQGGDPDSKNATPNAQLGAGDVGYTIPAEIITPGLYHKKGALAAARQGDQVNPQKASSGCQFYIVQGRTFTDAELDNMQRSRIMRTGVSTNDSAYMYSPQAREDYKTTGGTPHLDGNYTVFGEVTEGLDVVEKISKVKTNSSDRPVEDVKIIKMRKQ
ncbi:MAG: peptidylprolyl isomerase [Porphyromonadaceae bacterium]|nr:peptidylprolyl isomerase [Porphyromonadaceae bacterium]